MVTKFLKLRKQNNISLSIGYANWNNFNLPWHQFETIPKYQNLLFSSYWVTLPRIDIREFALTYCVLVFFHIWLLSLRSLIISQGKWRESRPGKMWVERGSGKSGEKSNCGWVVLCKRRIYFQYKLWNTGYRMQFRLSRPWILIFWDCIYKVVRNMP